MGTFRVKIQIGDREGRRYRANRRAGGYGRDVPQRAAAIARGAQRRGVRARDLRPGRREAGADGNRPVPAFASTVGKRLPWSCSRSPVGGPARRLCSRRTTPGARSGSTAAHTCPSSSQGAPGRARRRPAPARSSTCCDEHERTALAKRQRVNDEDAWRNAKKLCRLSGRQVEMARALGMNPRKLPSLRPGPQERWKLPVGAFIEACHRKRFGGGPESEDSLPREREAWTRPPDEAPEMASEPMEQAENLVCYLATLSQDLERWLEHGTIPPELLAEVGEELRAIAGALERGGWIPQLPEIAVPPDRAPSASRRRSERAFDRDDEPPF
jgi:hypothetical protein